jgi:hypothetical protein
MSKTEPDVRIQMTPKKIGMVVLGNPLTFQTITHNYHLNAGAGLRNR